MPVRQAGALAALRRSTTALAALAGDLESAAADALAADGAVGSQTAGGRAPICRLPDDFLSALDRRLTDAVGDGLSTLAAEAAGVVETIVAADSRHVSGDQGGRFSSRIVPFSGAAAGSAGVSLRSPAARTVVAALDATADETVLAHDEFGLVDHGGDRYTVVLPGVTDLSRPQQGWHPVHRSSRDFDMAALPSSRSSSVDDNPYARSVVRALPVVGVPVGADLLIVGHSFGADTALDLAADPAFTGRYDVTHVVATGYFSQPQLPSVPPGTEVLVVQNNRDVVVHLGSIMPATETGVLACEPTAVPGDDISIVRFDGGFGGFGHSVDRYRPVFTGQAELDSGDDALVHSFLVSIDLPSEPPATMRAVDISLPDEPMLGPPPRSMAPAAPLGPGDS